METSKSWYLSKAIWGGILGVLLGVIALIDQYFGTNLVHEGWYGLLTTLAASLGIYGRTVATTVLVK